jgi:imidazolonepropionase
MSDIALKKLAIVNIGQLVTLAGPARPRVGAEMRELGLIPDAALLVEDGRVQFVGSYSDLRERIGPEATVIDARGRLVTPGFVDAHTHLVFAGNRAPEFERRIGGATYQEIASAGGGIQSTVALTRQATEDELLSQARLHLDAARWDDYAGGQIRLRPGPGNRTPHVTRAGSVKR